MKRIVNPAQQFSDGLNTDMLAWGYVSVQLHAYKKLRHGEKLSEPETSRTAFRKGCDLQEQ